MRTPRILLVFLAALPLTASACAGNSAPELATTTTAATPLHITSPADMARIAGNVVLLQMQTTMTIMKADGDTSGKTGHFHVFIDRPPVKIGAAIPKEKGIIHSADNPIVVPGLTKGMHTLTVVLGNGNHVRITNAKAIVHVRVDGPTVVATAPATIAAGTPLSIEVKVDGVTLVKADGDTSGKTGHLHAFVDVPPVDPGVVIPSGNPAIIHSATSPIVVNGLLAGEHTIWIVLGDGTHTAFKDSARDKVVVTVT
jgi:uncharacterized protein DUF4399